MAGAQWTNQPALVYFDAKERTFIAASTFGCQRITVSSRLVLPVTYERGTLELIIGSGALVWQLQFENARDVSWLFLCPDDDKLLSVCMCTAACTSVCTLDAWKRMMLSGLMLTRWEPVFYGFRC